MLMKKQLRAGIAIVGFLLSMTADNFAQDRSANESGCVLLDKNKPAQLISYESRTESSSEIKLRLRNNTNCPIVIETDDVLPTLLRRLPNGSMRIEPLTGSQDGVTVRLHYLVQDRKREKAPNPGYGWGDSVFTYQILAGESVIFTVPASYFKRRFDVVVPFNYSWEGDTSIGMGAGGVIHRVYFLFDDLPLEALHAARREK